MNKTPEQRREEERTRPYCIVHHQPSGRSFRLNRQYGLIDSRNDLAGCPLGMTIVERWAGWKPTSQMPDWAVDLPEAEFYAFWVEPKPKKTCGFCGKAADQGDGHCPNRSFHNQG